MRRHKFNRKKSIILVSKKTNLHTIKKIMLIIKIFHLRSREENKIIRKKKRVEKQHNLHFYLIKLLLLFINFIFSSFFFHYDISTFISIKSMITRLKLKGIHLLIRFYFLV